MIFKVEFSHMQASGEFKPVMHQSFADLTTACGYADKSVMESAKTDRLHATVTGEDGRVLHQCWLDERGRFRDTTHDASYEAGTAAAPEPNGL
jgi:hypothetical protein